MVFNKETWLVDKALAIVLWISRLYGIAPLRFESTGIHTVAYISRPLYYLGILFTSLINLIVLACLIMLPTVVIEDSNTNDPKASNNHRILGFVSTFITISATWHGAFCGVFKMKSYLHCNMEINKVKNSLNSSYTSGPKQWHAICLLIVITFELWIMPLIDFWEYDTLVVLIYNIARNTLYGSLCMMALHFVFVSLVINSSFEVINKCLADVLSQIIRESLNEFPSLLERNAISHSYVPISAINKAIDLLGIMKQDLKMTPRMKLARETRKLSSCFVRTCEVVRELNDTVNFFLLVHIIIITLYLAMTINNIGQAISGTTDFKYSVMAECIWFVCRTLRMVMIVEPCHRFQKELSQTKMLVAQIMCEVTSDADPLFDATDNFLKQLLLNDVSFTVMGIFSLGRSIISTLVGGATTLYVVILEL